MSLTDNLRRLREKSGQSLQDVANAIGASKGTISGLERGSQTNPSFKLIRSLAQHFGVSVDQLTSEGQPVVPPGSPAQIDAWIRQIRKEQAAGSDLTTAAEEARIAFEALQGGPLDAQQKSNLEAARDQVAASLQQEIEYLENCSLRKPRRPEWYPGPAESDLHWPKLKAYLLERRKWGDETVRSIDAASSEVVSLLENPHQSEFRGRGLVVGYVQSGKTANMTAVIAKAVDAGYAFVIVLAGLTKKLRQQTQRRLETDLRDRNQHNWFLHTNREADGDFQTPANTWFAKMDHTQLAVVKKNVTPLGRLLKTIEKTPPSLLQQIPVLVIDDECDQASVNTSGTEYDMSRINGLIRTIISRLPRAQYIGYTATPFANVLINPETPDGVRDDLYPEDFITALPRSDGYFGPESLFGRDPVDAGEEEGVEVGLDMIRSVPEADVAKVQPASRENRELFEPSVPKSLEDALRYFILATACRHARGQRDAHSSMLVHTTVYTSTHRKLAHVIEEWLNSFKGAWPGDQTLRNELKELWESECDRVEASWLRYDRASFSLLEEHIAEVLDDIDIAIENSDSEEGERLDFESGPKTYIVVGGSVLARGLTIEGLSVSYFVRSSSQYDTLLQMGRWFGYRFGYEDLPRIWMTDDLAAAFRDLSTVEAEIRGDIAEYTARDVTPADFAVRIRQIPGMAITAASKMVAAEACDISFSGEHLQTIRFEHKNAERLNVNWSAGARMIDRALEGTEAEDRPQGRLIRDVPADIVLEFLRTYRASAKDSFGEPLLQYVERESERSDTPFQYWNVGVIEPRGENYSSDPLGGLGPVRQVNRARLNISRADGLADIKALMSRRDVLLDVDIGDTSGRWGDLKERRQNIIGDKVGLLLLYAIDPKSKPVPSSTYRTALDAVNGVLGVGLVLPERGARRSYVRVRLPEPDADEGENLAAELAAEETGGSNE